MNKDVNIILKEAYRLDKLLGTNKFYRWGPIYQMYIEKNEILMRHLDKVDKYRNESIATLRQGGYQLLLDKINNEPEEVQLRFITLYEEYKNFKNNLNNQDLYDAVIAELDELYCPILGKDSQYKTYHLIPIDNECRTLKIGTPPRIFDSMLQKTIYLPWCPLEVSRVLYKLFIDDNLIGKMSFKGSSLIYNMHNEDELLTEELERGRYFSLNLSDLPDVTKLYSKVYDDQLWVIKRDDNIYFEELSEDFDHYNDSIVTRLFHVEINNNYCIHMDFEYIFYTFDEFEQRKLDAKKKGEAQTRRKLFKLDDCKIPFDYKVELGNETNKYYVPLLYFFLDSFFKHKNLLEEYFDSCLKKLNCREEKILQ
jgi:hypothetical protein